MHGRTDNRGWFVLGLILLGCSPDRGIVIEPPPGNDAGNSTADANTVDGGPGPDAGVPDSGTDAGLEDAGPSDAGVSDAGCVDPRVECGALCTDTQNDPEHCGACENRCGAGQQCFLGICGTSVCGTCASGEYCETETRTCRSGCGSDGDCPQPGTCSASHTCTCGARQHVCGSACVSDDSTGSCGGSCVACSAPWNGTATCDGHSCGVSCDFGFHACGSSCYDSTSPDSCGQSCSPCPGTSNGYATCDNAQCRIACYSGYALCGASCVRESADQCGANCTNCPTPGVAHSIAACVSGACTYACEWPYLKTANGCELATEVHAGYYQTCARTTSGAVPCWGGGGGSLPTGATAISTGSPNCYLLSGQLVCGGSNITVSGASFSQVSVGDGHICAVTTDHRLFCWGSNTFGELGDSTTTYRSAPTQIYPANSVLKVSAGGSHTCAILMNGTATCWGYNYYGQVGNNDRNNVGTDVHSPVAVASLSGVTEIAAGEYHSCAISSGAVYCWGRNEWGALAHASDTCLPNAYHDHCPAPVAVTQLASSVTSLATGNDNTCAVKDGVAYCWGYNDSGEIGTGSHGHYGVYTPTAVIPSGASAVTTSVAGYYSCALLINGGVKCWGANSSGQLGDGTTSEQDSPVESTNR